MGIDIGVEQISNIQILANLSLYLFVQSTHISVSKSGINAGLNPAIIFYKFHCNFIILIIIYILIG